jgi:transketolase
MVKLFLIPSREFNRVRKAPVDELAKLELLSNMCRANTLMCVKRAGSGHLGSSFSSLDIVSWLYFAEMNTAGLPIGHPDRDIYFSSKGHDAPGLYAVLFSLGILPREKFINLRRLGGTFGHPDVRTPGIEANSGSLGMGISKAKGMAAAKALLGRRGRIFVMTGDGELQEGQIYEALQTAAHQKIVNLNVIVDHNKVQSDKPVAEIIDLGGLEAKGRAFGWHVSRCDGHDFRELKRIFAEFKEVIDKPKMLIADTLKGRGVSFMEHPVALRAGGGFYRWHAGAPDDQAFQDAYKEIIEGVNCKLAEIGFSLLTLEELPSEQRAASGVSREFVADAFGQALVEIAAKRTDIVVLDGDLAADCRIRDFETKYPERFIEDGIAEQDMVSMAGGLASQGLLPVVNTFASFLAAKANEQIYNNSCEQAKIIYACHYAGLIPAGPGSSHQSIRDISLFGALPGCTILQPCNAEETRMALRYCVEEAKGGCMLRLAIGPSPRIIALPNGYYLTPGQGVALSEGSDAVLFAYGPVMLHESLLAAETLRARGFGLKVINMPWLNRFDRAWLQEVVDPYRRVFVVEDHSPVGGLGDAMLNELVACGLLSTKRLEKFGVEGYPACGTPQEALQFHGLDGASLARRIRADCD